MGLVGSRHPAAPMVTLVAGVVLLGILAIPPGLRLAMPTDGTANWDPSASYEMVAEKFGDGRNAPMIAFVDTANVDAKDRPAAFQQLLQDFSTTQGVVNAQIIDTTENHDAAQVLITPETGATDEATTETLERLREFKGPFEEETGGTFGITPSPRSSMTFPKSSRTCSCPISPLFWAWLSSF